MNDQPGYVEAVVAGCQRNRALLEQCRGLVQLLDASQLCRSVSPVAGNTIGTQLRHLLDHLALLLAACDSGVVDYADRRRGQRCERDAQAALARIDELDAAFQRLSPETLRTTLEVVLEDGSRSPSTVVRELDFVASHATHHLALIALLATCLDVKVPPDLGVARATLRHRARG